jgi:hypothetical protein
MGGDYGFAWNPHGDYARELALFVKYVGIDPLTVLKCALETGTGDSGLGTGRWNLAGGQISRCVGGRGGCPSRPIAVAGSFAVHVL